MRFLDRADEMRRLLRLSASRSGGLVAMYGRRRIGKTRILLEWAKQADGLYSVADQSSPGIQRRYLAETIADRFPGFADVDYRDWHALLARLAQEAHSANWNGPFILDEFPYLVATSPELSSVLQRWLDHEAREARLSVAVAGSSQRMMQGLVLSSNAPLFGRATEILDVSPLAPTFLRDALGCRGGIPLVDAYTAWGGVPRYWELAGGLEGDTATRIDDLVLDPLGPLHREPERILIEEIPSAMEVRPLLDAIGAGAHRVSEIAGRIGRPATALSRPIRRLVEMSLIRRDVPFAEPERKSRRALYRIDDPFFRLWFRVVAPHRGRLAVGSPETRRRLLAHHWGRLAAQAWEDLCRKGLPRIHSATPVGRRGPWGPASSWWRGNMPEWDLVSESVDGRRLLLGEAKWSAKPYSRGAIERVLGRLASRTPPPLPKRYARHEIVRALFIPEREAGGRIRSDAVIVTAADLVRRSRAG